MHSLSVSADAAPSASSVRFAEGNRAGTQEPHGYHGDRPWGQGLWWLKAGLLGLDLEEERCVPSYRDIASDYYCGLLLLHPLGLVVKNRCSFVALQSAMRLFWLLLDPFVPSALPVCSFSYSLHFAFVVFSSAPH